MDAFSSTVFVFLLIWWPSKEKSIIRAWTRTQSSSALPASICRETYQNMNCSSCCCLFSSPFVMRWIANSVWLEKAFIFWRVWHRPANNGTGNHPFSSFFFCSLSMPLHSASSRLLTPGAPLTLSRRAEDRSSGRRRGCADRRPNYWIGDSFSRRCASCCKKWLLIGAVWTPACFQTLLSVTYTHRKSLTGMSNICVNHVLL